MVRPPLITSEFQHLTLTGSNYYYDLYILRLPPHIRRRLSGATNFSGTGWLSNAYGGLPTSYWPMMSGERRNRHVEFQCGILFYSLEISYHQWSLAAALFSPHWKHMLARPYMGRNSCRLLKMYGHLKWDCNKNWLVKKHKKKNFNKIKHLFINICVFVKIIIGSKVKVKQLSTNSS